MKKMKKCLLRVILISTSFGLGNHLFAQISPQQFQNENAEIIQSIVEDNGWNNLWHIMSNGGQFISESYACEEDPIIRFLYGHAALSQGDNNDQAMYQFYCNTDTTNSVTINQWEEWTKKILEKNPQSSNANYLYADALIRQERLDLGKKYLDRSIELSPNNYMAYNARGIVQWINLQIRNDFNFEYHSDFDSAKRLNPKFADAHVNHGVAKLLGNSILDSCLTDFNKAVNIDQEFSLAFNGRKTVYHFKKKITKYNDNLEKAKRTVFYMADTENYFLDSIARGALMIDGNIAPTVIIGSNNTVQNINNSGVSGQGSNPNITTPTYKTETLPTRQNYISSFFSNLINVNVKIPRGGVYSVQILGKNKNIASFSGTWFLLNYPFKNITANEKQ